MSLVGQPNGEFWSNKFDKEKSLRRRFKHEDGKTSRQLILINKRRESRFQAVTKHRRDFTSVSGFMPYADEEDEEEPAVRLCDLNAILCNHLLWLSPGEQRPCNYLERYILCLNSAVKFLRREIKENYLEDTLQSNENHHRYWFFAHQSHDLSQTSLQFIFKSEFYCQLTEILKDIERHKTDSSSAFLKEITRFLATLSTIYGFSQYDLYSEFWEIYFKTIYCQMDNIFYGTQVDFFFLVGNLVFFNLDLLPYFQSLGLLQLLSGKVISLPRVNNDMLHRQALGIAYCLSQMLMVYQFDHLRKEDSRVTNLIICGLLKLLMVQEKFLQNLVLKALKAFFYPGSEHVDTLINNDDFIQGALYLSHNIEDDTCLTLLQIFSALSAIDCSYIDFIVKVCSFFENFDPYFCVRDKKPIYQVLGNIIAHEPRYFSGMELVLHRISGATLGAGLSLGKIGVNFIDNLVSLEDAVLLKIKRDYTVPLLYDFIRSYDQMDALFERVVWKIDFLLSIDLRTARPLISRAHSFSLLPKIEAITGKSYLS